MNNATHLRTPTAVTMIVASALGYVFLTGVRTFAIVFAAEQYGIGRGAATGVTLLLGAGALAGYLAGRRLPDLLVGPKIRAAHVWSTAAAFPASAIALASAAIALTNLDAAISLLMLGTGLLAAANPPLDAARLDVIPAHRQGRAEAVRSALRSLGESAAPTGFGFLANDLFHGPQALSDAFLLGLLPLAAAGLITLRAVRSHPRDAAAVSDTTGPASAYPSTADRSTTR